MIGQFSLGRAMVEWYPYLDKWSLNQTQVLEKNVYADGRNAATVAILFT